MYKRQIQKVTNYSGYDDDIQVAANRISDMLFAIPSDVDLGAMMSVERFKDDGAFGIFTSSDSGLNDSSKKECEKNKVLNNLDSILLEVTSWIKDNPLVVKYNIMTTGKKKSSHRRKVMIIILVVIAVVAIVLTIIQHTTNWIGESVPIGEIIGLVDLVMGIGGLVYEIADDGKKENICSAVDDISKSESLEDLEDGSDKLIEAKNKNIMLSLIHIGKTEQIGQQIIINGKAKNDKKNDYKGE